jgi:hypothetical protein
MSIGVPAGVDMSCRNKIRVVMRIRKDVPSIHPVFGSVDRLALDFVSVNFGVSDFPDFDVHDEFARIPNEPRASFGNEVPNAHAGFVDSKLIVVSGHGGDHPVDFERLLKHSRGSDGLGWDSFNLACDFRDDPEQVVCGVSHLDHEDGNVGSLDLFDAPIDSVVIDGLISDMQISHV